MWLVTSSDNPLFPADGVGLVLRDLSPWASFSDKSITADHDGGYWLRAHQC